MTCRLFAVCCDATQPPDLARFWSGLLGWEAADDPHGGVTLLPSDDTGFRLRFVPTREPKTGRNLMRFDLTSTSLEDQRQTVDRALELGARRIDEPLSAGRGPRAGHLVLADPGGNEFHVVGPGDDRLAGCGFVGALACDGSREVGHFWSRALGWPLVRDQDQETAIRSPHGGPMIMWGGPPLLPRTGRGRLRFDLAPPLHGDRQAEVDRLLSLGATRVGTGRSEISRVAMADPDGNDFWVLTPR